MELIENILAVSWQTKYCNKTIQHGISLAQKYHANLSVIHVTDAMWLHGWNIPMVSVEKEHRKDMEKHKKELHHIITVANKKGMAIKEFVKEGTPSQIILQLINDENIDLLILRNHEESRLERMLVGGSNDEIIRAMPCSIFLIKPGRCEEDIK